MFMLAMGKLTECYCEQLNGIVRKTKSQLSYIRANTDKVKTVSKMNYAKNHDAGIN